MAEGFLKGFLLLEVLRFALIDDAHAEEDVGEIPGGIPFRGNVGAFEPHGVAVLLDVGLELEGKGMFPHKTRGKRREIRKSEKIIREGGQDEFVGEIFDRDARFAGLAETEGVLGDSRVEADHLEAVPFHLDVEDGAIDRRKGLDDVEILPPRGLLAFLLLMALDLEGHALHAADKQEPNRGEGPGEHGEQGKVEDPVFVRFREGSLCDVRGIDLHEGPFGVADRHHVADRAAEFARALEAGRDPLGDRGSEGIAVGFRDDVQEEVRAFKGEVHLVAIPPDDGARVIENRRLDGDFVKIRLEDGGDGRLLEEANHDPDGFGVLLQGGDVRVDGGIKADELLPVDAGNGDESDPGVPGDARDEIIAVRDVRARALARVIVALAVDKADPVETGILLEAPEHLIIDPLGIGAVVIGTEAFPVKIRNRGDRVFLVREDVRDVVRGAERKLVDVFVDLGHDPGLVPKMRKNEDRGGSDREDQAPGHAVDNVFIPLFHRVILIKCAP